MDDTPPLDPVRYRFLLDLHHTAQAYLEGALSPEHNAVQDRDSIYRIRELVSSLDRTIAQLSTTLRRQ